jgi:hypothetical protein
MEDRFLHELRREPPAGFSRALREHLRGIEDESPARGFRLMPALATAATAALIAFAFTLPAVRVAAQNALDMFRVKSFAPVEIDPARLDQLRALRDQTGKDPAMLVFDDQEVLQKPAQPIDYPSADMAGSAAGLPGLRRPGVPLPNGMSFTKATVSGDGAARVTLHVDRLRKLVDLLGLNDVHVPSQLDGQKVLVHMPKIVAQEFVNGTNHLSLVEAHSPEVTLPPGVNLAELGEIGLRVLGLDADEAHRVAASIDWKSTLIVPVPPGAESFRQVTVNGHKGLLIRCERTDANGNRHRSGGMLVWTEGDRVLGMQSNISGEDIVEVAQTLR